MRYLKVQEQLREQPRTWLVTGAAGFIGSHLVEQLLRLDQRVVGFDNFATGSRANLEEVSSAVGDQARLFQFVEGDIRNLEQCRHICSGVDVVLHQAALGSVPRSIENPVATHQSNVDGFLNILVAARDAGVKRFIYAASSSTYGDHPGLPKVEDVIGRPLSPYAVTKYVNELYAQVFARSYSMENVGLRYFNVYGPRQDPDGAYAAVIPRWIGNLLRGEPCMINGDGTTSRDFTYVSNVVQANLLAATADESQVAGEVFNVAVGHSISLNELFQMIRDDLAVYYPALGVEKPHYRNFRPGDIRHSKADIRKITTRLGYVPTDNVRDELRKTLAWFVANTPSISRCI